VGLACDLAPCNGLRRNFFPLRHTSDYTEGINLANGDPEGSAPAVAFFSVITSGHPRSSDVQESFFTIWRLLIMESVEAASSCWNGSCEQRHRLSAQCTSDQQPFGLCMCSLATFHQDAGRQMVVDRNCTRLAPKIVVQFPTK